MLLLDEPAKNKIRMIILMLGEKVSLEEPRIFFEVASSLKNNQKGKNQNLGCSDIW
jgi:hypothetical protein